MPRPRRLPAPKEAVVHAQIAAWLRVVLPQPWRFSTIPSGGGGRIRGAQLKRMGLQKGVPDILVLHPAGDWVGLEVKRQDKASKPSPEQVEWIDWSTRERSQSARIGVVRSIADAQAFLRARGVL